MKRTRRNIMQSLAVTAILAVIVLARYFICSYPCTNIQGEIPGFLYNYSQLRPVGELVFDPYINDWNMYQARELSYFLDFLDARFIFFCWVREFRHLFSPVAFLLLAGSVFAQQFFGARLFPRFGRIPLALCSLIYVLLPFADVGFFRSSKHVCALLITLTVFRTMELLHGKFREGRSGMIRILLYLTLLPLFDRQGMFFTASYAVFCGCLCLGAALGLRVVERAAAGQRRLAIFTLSSLFPVAFSALNYSVTAPLLIHHFNGYYPDSGYASLKVSDEASGAAFFCKALYCGADFVFANIGHALTGVTPQAAAFAIGLACAAAVLVLFFRKEKTDPAFPALLFILTAMTVCATAMYIRHPPIVNSYVIYTGYFKPFAAALFPFCLLALRHIPHRVRIVYPLVLCAVILIPFPSFGTPENASDVPPGVKFTRELMSVLDDPEVDPRTRPMPYHFRIFAERVRMQQTGKAPDYTSPGAW